MNLIIAIISTVIYIACIIYVCISAPMHDEEDEDGTGNKDDKS